VLLQLFDIKLSNNSELEKLIKTHGIIRVKVDDKRFPESLKEIKRKKMLESLYLQGKDIKFDRCIAIIGTRNCSTFGAEFARKLSIELALNDFKVISGLARGIDASAHRGTISANGITIAVLPWLHTIYPPEHENLANEITEKGCILSENFKIETNQKYSFLQRNEIIVALSDYVIIVESKYAGGTKYAFEYATKLGKPIIVIKPEKEYGEFYEGYKKFVEYGAFECSNISHVITKISET